MIERLHDMPLGTLGFRATGGIQREDYDQVLTPRCGRHSTPAQGCERSI
jgi:hypothetical protein